MAAIWRCFVILNVHALSRSDFPIGYAVRCGKPYQDPSSFVTHTQGTMNEFYKNTKEEQVPVPKILRKTCIEVCRNTLVINLKRVLALFAESCRPTRSWIQNWDIARFVVTFLRWYNRFYIRALSGHEYSCRCNLNVRSSYILGLLLTNFRPQLYVWRAGILVTRSSLWSVTSWILCVRRFFAVVQHVSIIKSDFWYNRPSMHGTLLDQRVFESLVQRCLPLIHDHFQAVDVQLSVASLPWFLSL